MKVFCINCKHVVHKSISYAECEHPNNMSDTWFAPSSNYLETPATRNKHNDCGDFEEKI